MSSDSKVTGGEYAGISDLVAKWMEANGGYHGALSKYEEMQRRAVASCFTVSPSDPQAAAEAYPEIAEALVNLVKRAHPFAVTYGDDTGRLPIDEALSGARAALAKVGR